MEVFLSMVSIFGCNFAPRNWAFCDGQLIAITSNTALFSLTGTAYGGDGRTTFGLPDLRGRTAVGHGAPPEGPLWKLGEKTGYTTHTMNLVEMPMHTHEAITSISSATVSIPATVGDADSTTPTEGCYLAKSVAPGGPQDAPEKMYAESAAEGTVNMAAGTLSNLSLNVQIAPAGEQRPFNIVQPSLGVNYCIALEGIFPSRS